MAEDIDFTAAFADMAKWARTVPETLSREAPRFAEPVRAQVESKVPVLTGTLARSVVIEPEPEGFGIGLGAGVIYAGYIEFGGRHGRELVPQGRYLYPTMVENETALANGMNDAVSLSIDRYPWAQP